MCRRKQLSIISRTEGLFMHAVDGGWATSAAVVGRGKIKHKLSL